MLKDRPQQTSYLLRCRERILFNLASHYSRNINRISFPSIAGHIGTKTVELNTESQEIIVRVLGDYINYSKKSHFILMKMDCNLRKRKQTTKIFGF